MVDLERDDEAGVLAVDDGDEAHEFDVVDERELRYRGSDGTSAAPPEAVVEALETRGYVVTVESGDETRP